MRHTLVKQIFYYFDFHDYKWPYINVTNVCVNIYFESIEVQTTI